jgi:hypothetical protein
LKATVFRFFFSVSDLNGTEKERENRLSTTTNQVKTKIKLKPFVFRNNADLTFVKRPVPID